MANELKDKLAAQINSIDWENDVLKNIPSELD
jgi:hypothetical protein